MGMSGGVGYQALARKYRPENFDELSGQDEVVAALKNSLSSGKIHHAYLLSGTRGSGKTTVARIMAKALECEAGNPAQPCCACETCKSIAAGDFIDVTEIDAASRTGIEDMRELIENVMYKPVKGKYKIFIIDEVHMLSLSSFNALLKTLEEPPEHVKFILATTDPQKLPVTVLSRCVHFRFLPLPSELIKNRLAYVLERENVSHDGQSLELIAAKCGGSMRDALSITDQMVSLCAGNLTKNKVADALGCLDDEIVFELAAAACLNDTPRCIAAAEKVKSLNPGYKSVLDALISCIHETVMSRALMKCGRASDVYKHSAGMDSVPDSILHLAYQILLNAKRDFDLAPSQELAFEMTVMRLLSYASIAWSAESGAGAGNSDKSVKKNFSDGVTESHSPSAHASAVTADAAQPAIQTSAAEPTEVSETVQKNSPAQAVAPAFDSPVQANNSQSGATNLSPSQSQQSAASSSVEHSEVGSEEDMALLSQLLSMGRVEQAPQIPRQDASDEPPVSNWKPGPSSVFGKSRIGEPNASSDSSSGMPSEDVFLRQDNSEKAQPGDDSVPFEPNGSAVRNAAEMQVAQKDLPSADSLPQSQGNLNSQAMTQVLENLPPNELSAAPSQNFASQNAHDSADRPVFASSAVPAASAPTFAETPDSFGVSAQPAAASQQMANPVQVPIEQGFSHAQGMNNNAAALPSTGQVRFDCRNEYLENDTMPRVAEKDPWTDAIMKMNLSDMTKTMLIGTTFDLASGAVKAPADFAYLLTEDVLNEVREQYLRIVPEGTAVPKFVLIASGASPEGTPSELMRQYYDKLCQQQFDKLQSDEPFQELVKRFGCAVGISDIHLLKG